MITLKNSHLPALALVMYKEESKVVSQGEYYSHSQHNSISFSPLATLHDVKDGKIQSGSPIDVISAYKLLETVIASSSEESDEVYAVNPLSLLPENVLVNNQDTVAWWSSSRVAKLWFRINGGKPLLMQRRIPALFWLHSKSKIKVFSLGANKRPCIDDALYRAPFMNTYEDGSVCWGGKMPDVFSFGDLASGFSAVEKEYIEGSAFSHTNDASTPILVVNGKYISETDDLYRYWKSKKEDAKRFPYSHLVPQNETIGSLLLEDL